MPMANNPDDSRIRRPGLRRSFWGRSSAYQSIQDDHYEFLPMVEDPYEAPLQRTASAPYDLFPITDNKGNEDVNVTTCKTQICVAEVHFDNGNADEDSGLTPGFCIAEVNFDTENIGDDSDSSSNVLPMAAKDNKDKGLQEEHTDPITEFCIAELNFNKTPTHETDDMELQEFGTRQDEPSTNEMYEKLQKTTGLGAQQGEGSTNEIYEQLQKDTDIPDLDDTNGSLTQDE
jgi:hypothetical protein